MGNDILVNATASHDWFDYLTLICTIAGIVILAYYTWYTKQMMQATKASLEHAQKSSAEALKQIIRSNEATEKSNQIAWDNLEYSTRAWITVKLESNFVLEPDSEWRGCASLVNRGRTPAVDVKTRIDYYEFRTAIPEGAREEMRHVAASTVADDAIFDGDRPMLGGAVLGPGDTLWMGTEAQIFSPHEIASISTAETVCVLRCVVNYTDWFHKARTTEACWYYSCLKRAWVATCKRNRMD